MYLDKMITKGTYCMFEPIGLTLSIKYNKRGAIENIAYYVSETHTQLLDDNFLHMVIANDVVPRTILLKGSTTFVSGVLYSNKLVTSVGTLPIQASKEIIEDFKQDPQSYQFLASSVLSQGVHFMRHMDVTHWLNLNKFNVTPGALITVDKFVDIAHNLNKFTDPYKNHSVFGAVVTYFGPEWTRRFTNLIQDNITKLDMTVDKQGVIYADIKLSQSNALSRIHWPQVYFHDLQKGKLVIVDSTDEQTILHSRYTDNKKHTPVGDKVICPTCNKLIPIKNKIFTCDDPKCSSLQYQRIVNYMTALRLPVISYGEFSTLTEHNKHITILDVLKSELYNSLVVTSTLGDQLNAFIPRSILPRKRDALKLADKCNDNIEVLRYYIDNPHKAYIDLELDKHIYTKFFNWIIKDDNAELLFELLQSPNIELTIKPRIAKNFPIFRDKKIFITGMFVHGSYQYISEIIESYQGATTTKYSNDCDCVLIGDIPENVDGRAIHKAFKNRVPVIHESIFFDKYDIDRDIQNQDL